MGKRITHEKLGADYELVELRQRDVEAFQRDYIASVKGVETVSEKAGITVRVAAKLGLVHGLKEELVPDLPPNVVLWLSIQIHAHVGDALKIPPL